MSRKSNKYGKPAQVSTKVTQSVEELRGQCDDQVSFLLNSCEAFDKGKTNESKRLATAIRILVHDYEQADSGRPSSISLFKQLGLKTTFFDSSINAPETEGNRQLLMTQVSLVGRLFGNQGHYYRPHLGNPTPDKMVDFERWWNQDVIIDGEGVAFSRRRIILAVANKDGGAHVDARLDADYYRLTRLNSVQDSFTHINANLSVEDFLKQQENAPASTPPVSPAFYTVRQIAHEILVSRLSANNPNFPNFYDYDENLYSGGSIAFSAIYEEEDKDYHVEQGRVPIASMTDEEKALIHEMLGKNV